MEITSIESGLYGVWTPAVTAQWAAKLSSVLLDESIDSWSGLNETLWHKALRDDHSDSMVKYLCNFDELTILRLERDFRRYGELLPSGD